MPEAISEISALSSRDRFKAFKAFRDDVLMAQRRHCEEPPQGGDEAIWILRGYKNKIASSCYSHAAR